MALNDVPRPVDVPGFQAAYAQGLTPRVTPALPQVLPGTSARGRFVVLLAVLGVLAVAAAVLLVGSGRTSFVLLVVTAAAVVLALVAGIPIVGARMVTELQAGYTTLVLKGGLPSLTGVVRPLRGGHLAWDYAGTWVLRPSGEVVSRPAPGSISPGFYPSPVAPGRFELWTGAEWSRQYQRPRARG